LKKNREKTTHRGGGKRETGGKTDSIVESNKGRRPPEVRLSEKGIPHYARKGEVAVGADYKLRGEIVELQERKGFLTPLQGKKDRFEA